MNERPQLAVEPPAVLLVVNRGVPTNCGLVNVVAGVCAATVSAFVVTVNAPEPAAGLVSS